MRALRTARRAEVVTLSLVTASFVLLGLPDTAQEGIARRANHLVLLPVARVRGVFGGYLKLREENAALRAELERARLELGETRVVRVQNRQLRRMLDFAADQPVRLTAGRVIDRNFGTLPTTFLLDVGRRDGVERNQPVVSVDGIVGKTVNVGPATSEVMVYAHPEFSASALIIGGDHLEYGIVRPDADGDLRLYLPLRSTTGPGDPIVTSGYGGVFPRGIPLGRVSERGESDRLGLQKIDRVRPVVDLARVANVFVLSRDVDAGQQAGEVLRMFWPGFAYPPMAGETFGRGPAAGAGEPDEGAAHRPER